MLVSAFLLASLLQTSPAPSAPVPAQTPADQAADQANAQAAIEGMAQIMTAAGSCERHLSPAQVQGVRQALEPERGQRANPLQAYLAAAYERGRSDQTPSAAFCQEMMRVLSETRAPG